jgi:acyl carrier protein phosphodiesterase
MATEREMELAKQILAKLTAMENKLDKLDGSLDKLDDLKGVHKDLQNTFTKGFADVNKDLAEIKQSYKNRRSAREIVEGIAGNGKRDN